MLLPKVEENTWTFVFELKGNSPVEVFELSNPVRIILDIKGGLAAKTAAFSPKHHRVAQAKTHARKASASPLKSAESEEDSALPLEHEPKIESAPADDNEEHE